MDAKKIDSFLEEDNFEVLHLICEDYDGFRKLNENQKMLVDLYEFSLETNNGGIHQYLVNSSAKNFLNVCRTLDLIGAKGMKDVLYSIQNKFPKNIVPESRMKRGKVLDKLGNSGEYFDSETDRYYSNEEDMFKKMVEYIRENKQSFL